MDSKEIYKAFCEKEKSLPLFLTYGWLNAVAPDHWDVVIEVKGGEVIGVFPYILNRRKGLSFIELPPLTAYGGPWISYPDGQKYASALSHEKEVYTWLIEQLPSFDSMVLKLHPSIINGLPFYWKGYSLHTSYTYIIKDLSNCDQLFINFKENIRREIRKAGKNISVKTAESIDILFELKLRSNTEAGIPMNISRENLEKIYSFCQQNHAGELLIAAEGNHIHAAALFVWDTHTAYYLYGASDPDHKTSGAMSLLLWQAIQRYSSKVSEFNFEGSMIEEIERFFRAFGGQQTPYLVIKKCNSKLLKIKNFVKDLKA